MLFQREDYVFGMNVIAVTAFICGITILTIQVMETHFHIIARGRPQDCDRFARSIVVKLHSFLTKAGRRFAVKGRLKVSNDPIFMENELKTKFNGCLPERHQRRLPKGSIWRLNGERQDLISLITNRCGGKRDRD